MEGDAHVAPILDFRVARPCSAALGICRHILKMDAESVIEWNGSL